MAEMMKDSVSLSGLNASIEKLQNIFLDMTNALTKEKAEKSSAETLLIEWERDIKGLENNEKGLIKEFIQVMSNLYLLPGYVLAVSTGVSGLLASDPHFCWLFSHVIVVVIIYLVSMWLAIRDAYRQLITLEAKKGDLVRERVRLHQSFLDNIDTFDPHARRTNLVLKRLESYETMNSELASQAQHFTQYLLLIATCGLVYAFMLLVAGYYVLCGSQPTGHLPSTPCLQQAIPIEPVPGHLPFSPCSSGLRLHQDM